MSELVCRRHVQACLPSFQPKQANESNAWRMRPIRKMPAVMTATTSSKGIHQS